MGQLVYLEQHRIKQNQRIRAYALKNFPWEEMDLIQQYIVVPLIEKWDKKKQIIITEATFRLVYESYVTGLGEQKYKKGTKQQSEHQAWDQDSSQKAHHMIDKVMKDFLIYRIFTYEQQEPIKILFYSLVQEWFLRGLMDQDHMK